MPKRTDIQSILIIGAGPIVIGQACEFDYSGAQVPAGSDCVLYKKPANSGAIMFAGAGDGCI
jgi:hypothetical protein